MTLRYLLPVWLAATGSMAGAATFSYAAIDEKVSTAGSFAAAASNGSGVTGGPTQTGSSTNFDALIGDQLVDQHLDSDGNPDEIATAGLFAQQRSILTPLTLSSAGSVSSNTSIFGAGLARAETVSTLRTSFTLDADASLSAYAFVTCEGASCLSFVTLSSSTGTLFDTRSTAGDKAFNFVGLLLAQQSYVLEASTGAQASSSGSGQDDGAGAYLINLSFTAPVGNVPEPATALLLLAGGALLARVRANHGRKVGHRLPAADGNVLGR